MHIPLQELVTMLSQSEMSQSEPFDKGRILLNYSFQLLNKPVLLVCQKHLYLNYWLTSLGPWVFKASNPTQHFSFGTERCRGHSNCFCHQKSLNKWALLCCPFLNYSRFETLDVVRLSDPHHPQQWKAGKGGKALAQRALDSCISHADGFYLFFSASAWWHVIQIVLECSGTACSIALLTGFSKRNKNIPDRRF